MVYGYIRYGNQSPEWLEMTTEQRNEKVKKLKKEAAKHGFKLLVWGGPFGVSEEIVCVYESDKDLHDFIAMNQVVPHPMTNVRTHIVYQPFDL